MAWPDIAARLTMFGLAGLSLIWEGVPVLRHHVGIVATPAITMPRPGSSGSDRNDPPDLTPVLALSPFGRLQVDESGPGIVTVEAPEFSLHGIIVAQAPRRSVALISVQGGQALYRTGDGIAGTGQIGQITPGQVEIDIGGQRTVLYLDAEVLLADGDTDGPKPVARAPVSLLERMRAGTVVAARNPRAEPPETPEQYIDYWRRRIRKNPTDVLQAIGLKPSGQGYVIARNHDSGVRLAGLRAGDLVRSVNGRQVGNPDTDRRFFDQIAASGQARLEVQRGDDILTLSFPLR